LLTHCWLCHVAFLHLSSQQQNEASQLRLTLDLLSHLLDLGMFTGQRCLEANKCQGRLMIEKAVNALR